MSVPKLLLCVSQIQYLAHVDLDDRHPRLHQPAGQQQRLAEGVPSVAVADGYGFALQVEGLGDLARGEDGERLLLLIREAAALGRAGQVFTLPIDVCQQRPAIAEALHSDLRIEAQPVHAEVRRIGVAP